MGFGIINMDDVKLVGIEVKEVCGCFIQDGRYDVQGKKCPHVEATLVPQQVRL